MRFNIANKTQQRIKLYMASQERPVKNHKEIAQYYIDAEGLSYTTTMQEIKKEFRELKNKGHIKQVDGGYLLDIKIAPDLSISFLTPLIRKHFRTQFTYSKKRGKETNKVISRVQGNENLYFDMSKDIRNGKIDIENTGSLIYYLITSGTIKKLIRTNGYIYYFKIVPKMFKALLIDIKKKSKNTPPKK